MNNAELKEKIADVVGDEEELNHIIVLEGDEFADGAIGLSQDNRVIYDYGKTVESLKKHNKWTDEEAIEWLDYNTLRALPYMEKDGKAPIFVWIYFENC